MLISTLLVAATWLLVTTRVIGLKMTLLSVSLTDTVVASNCVGIYCTALTVFGSFTGLYNYYDSYVLVINVHGVPCKL